MLSKASPIYYRHLDPVKHRTEDKNYASMFRARQSPKEFQTFSKDYSYIPYLYRLLSRLTTKGDIGNITPEREFPMTKITTEANYPSKTQTDWLKLELERLRDKKLKELQDLENQSMDEFVSTKSIGIDIDTTKSELSPTRIIYGFLIISIIIVCATFVQLCRRFSSELICSPNPIRKSIAQKPTPSELAETTSIIQETRKESISTSISSLNSENSFINVKRKIEDLNKEETEQLITFLTSYYKPEP
ncbi:uncharacterized protein LOC111635353 [Centruroides sculpturatus]|uniref:uncharacterized protein LOC111635353 n=1 Tax=Centruroides sculpturatus TaxID=218467 RepID=UPI000C6CAA91|nr:uncharacterized protein LOC111635353 [Centruroides sculpturatus]